MIRILALWAAVLSGLILMLVVREEKLAARGKVPLGRLRRLWMRSERRRAPRYRVDWSVRYERASPPPMNGNGKTRDVSSTGAGLTVREKLPVGSFVLLELAIPEQLGPVQVHAEVVWTKEIPAAEPAPAPSLRTFFVGIRFQNLPPELEQQIQKALAGGQPL